jgi:hypothetical protein
MTAPPDLLGVLCDMIADRIVLRITTAPERETFDSRNLPPRTSRRRFAEVCRAGRVADARREGRDWTCSRAAWEAARRRGPKPSDTTPHEPSLDMQADDLLAASGLRIVRGGGR